MLSLKRKTTRFSLYFGAQEKDITLGVKKRLNNFLLKYDDDLGGVMLEYSNMALFSKQMQISSNRTPYLHVEVAVDATIFNPKPGNKLVGQVNHLGGDFLSVLVYGIFNAVIFQSQIRGNFQPVSGTKTWVNKENKWEVIKQGSMIIFEVVRIDKQGNIFGITGSMLQPTSGPVKSSLQQEEYQIKFSAGNEIGTSGFVDSIDVENQLKIVENGHQDVKSSNGNKLKKKEKKRKREEGEDKKEKKKKKKKQKTGEQNQESTQVKIKKENEDQNGTHEEEANGVICLLDSDDDKKEKKKKKKKKDKEKKNKNKDGNSLTAEKEQNQHQLQQGQVSGIVANGDTNQDVKKKKKKKHKDTA